MAELSEPSKDRYRHLRTYSAMQKQTTVERLKQAIMQLEAEGRPVNTFTIKEVSDLDYMVYYRNREAFAFFQQHSTHLRKEREKQHSKQQTHHISKRQNPQKDEVIHQVKVKPRDPLLDYKRPRLVELLHEAWAERDQMKQQTQAKKTELEKRYSVLLQDHMQCELKIARLEAELAEFRAFMARFRSSLRHEENEP